MTGQAFFLTLAGLALSVAGFGGLVGAFRRGDEWTQVDLWRLRNIVWLSFITMFLALAPVTAFALFGDEPLSVRLGSALVVGATLYEISGVQRERGEWSEAGWVRAYYIIIGSQALLQIANLVFASPGLLLLGLVLRLQHPANLFLKVVASFRPPSTRV